jgi:hypothetical protein
MTLPALAFAGALPTSPWHCLEGARQRDHHPARRILGVSADELLGLEKPARADGGSIKNRRIFRQLQSIDRLPKRDQEALARTIDAILAKAS